jgi:hypothetical protein
MKSLLVDKILADVFHEMSIEELELLQNKVLPLIIKERKFRKEEDKDKK